MKELHGKGKIFGWYVSNGLIKVKLQEKGGSIYISHMEVFTKYFPDADFSSL